MSVFKNRQNLMPPILSVLQHIAWVSTQEDLSVGISTKKGSNQPAQLQRLIRILKPRMLQYSIRRILGEYLLISSLLGKASRMHVESMLSQVNLISKLANFVFFLSIKPFVYSSK